MKLLRFRPADIQGSQWGWLDGDRIGLIEGSPFGTFRRRDAAMGLDEVALLPPVAPGKVICVGRNYAAHAEEHAAEVPELPLIFLKPPSSVIAAGEPILIPPQSQRVEHEAELAIVISQAGRWLSSKEAKQHILGFTAANDVTARDLQRADGQWTRGKGFDTFCPLGPWIETEFDPADAMVTCNVNGKMRQMGSTRDMVFPSNQLIAFVSSVMTLEPGDVILTGTPSGVGPLHPGDEVSVEIEGIGALTNPVKQDSTSPNQTN
ncbi:MAG: fumarylacetoacetate hydrolase family protein [Anaerolineales bacterium]